MSTIHFSSIADFLANKESKFQSTVEEIKEILSVTDSENLKALGNKINHMCLNIGSPSSILPMLQRIVRGKKKLTKDTGYHSVCFLGHGHFRWNDSAIILSDDELLIVQRVINFIENN